MSRRATFDLWQSAAMCNAVSPRCMQIQTHTVNQKSAPHLGIHISESHMTFQIAVNMIQHNATYHTPSYFDLVISDVKVKAGFLYIATKFGVFVPHFCQGALLINQHSSASFEAEATSCGNVSRMSDDGHQRNWAKRRKRRNMRKTWDHTRRMGNLTHVKTGTIYKGIGYEECFCICLTSVSL